MGGNSFSRKIFIKGKITADADVHIERINIVNLSEKMVRYPDAHAEFVIAASRNDSLSISAVYIQGTTIVIGQEQLNSKKISINLTEKMNALAAVTLRRALTGYIAADAKTIKNQRAHYCYECRIAKRRFKTALKTQRLLYAANSGPIDALMKMFSGRAKMLKNAWNLKKPINRLGRC